MGKKGGGNSWFTAVKRAFRSPTKENKTSGSGSGRRREENEQDEEEKQKREKRRWIFRKSSNQETVVTNQEEPKKTTTSTTSITPPALTPDEVNHVSAADQRHAIAVAVATAEAAMATARAAVEVVRLTRPPSSSSNSYDRSAVIIQTAFRGYLARRALRALKGLVKLQALVRGHNVRKQAKMTLQCMQALVRVQTRVRDQRMRLSQDGSRNSAISDTNSCLFESRYYQDIAERLSISRDGSRSSIADDWDDRPHTIEEIQAMLQRRKESALKREKALAHAFSHQIWRSGRNTSVGNEEEMEERPKWLDRWMATKPWENRGRASTDQREPIKTVEVDTSRPYAYSTPSLRRSQPSQYHHQQQQHSSTMGSPMHRTQHQHHRLSLHHSPVTPSPSKTRPPIQVRSASPRCGREERQPYTPSVASYYNGDHGGATAMPNYMAATESAKARIRSQSAPRVRPSTPERDGSAKKRLSFPTHHEYGGNGGFEHSLRSPSFKSTTGYAAGRRGSPHVHAGGMMEQYYTDRDSLGGGSNTPTAAGGEISPSSTSELRRWLR
ncbi:hypothetical protein ACHQM5_000022 [Ranunculus cassubicifolius]